MGRGDKLSFWKDNLVREMALSDAFPRFFRASMNRDALVSEFCREDDGGPQWMVTFRREQKEFEEELFLRGLRERCRFALRRTNGCGLLIPQGFS